MDSISDDVKSIERQTETAISRAALKLHSDLVKVAPVDTGFFRRSWRVRNVGNKQRWFITNNAEYASFLWRGHSKQWNGGDSMLAKANADLTRKFKQIKAG